MFEWSEEQLMIRDAVRQFVDKEIRPHVDALEHGDMPPYDILRKLFKTFGMDVMAKAAFEARIKAEKEGTTRAPREGVGGGDSGMTMIPIIELCRVCPGMVTAMAVSMGLTSA